MPSTVHIRVAASLLAAVLSVPMATAVAQTADPCAAAGGVASPTSATPTDVGAMNPPTDEEAVLLALSIRQEQVVTALEIARMSDGALADLAGDRLEEAQDHLAAILAQVPIHAPTDSAQVVAVIDRLRQERDLPAGAAALTVWQPGLAETVLCSGADRDAATITLLRDASEAIVDLTGLAEPLLEDDAELLAAIRAAAEERIDALATLPIAPATPVIPNPGRLLRDTGGWKEVPHAGLFDADLAPVQ